MRDRLLLGVGKREMSALAAKPRGKLCRGIAKLDAAGQPKHLDIPPNDLPARWPGPLLPAHYIPSTMSLVSGNALRNGSIKSGRARRVIAFSAEEIAPSCQPGNDEV